MSAGLVQLVAVGAQDQHLTGDPDVSYFRSTYKRHTHFVQVINEHTIEGQQTAQNMSTVRFEKSGDLLGFTYLVASNSSGEAQAIQEWKNYIDYVELLIGGQVIDKQDSEFSQELAVDILATSFAKSASSSLAPGLGSDGEFYPLRFFFCEHWQSMIPLVALQYHDVELRIYWGANAGTVRWNIYSSYAYLGPEERQYFLDKDHEILMFQVQKSIPTNSKVQFLNFNSPVKVLTSSNAVVGVNNSLCSRTNKITISVNNTELFKPKPTAPHFTSISSYYNVPYASGNKLNQFIYPFCMDTSKLQPSGTLNFSRVESVKIISDEPITRNIYAVNYNILKVKNGLGALLYSN